MKSRSKSSNILIPLSSNQNMSSREVGGLDDYYLFLNTAFQNPQIRNIAMTGAFGIGKSSIIRSFDVHKHKTSHKKEKFLYISLGKYVNSNSALSCPKSAAGQENTQIPCKDNDNINGIDSDKNEIERRLLLQIYSRFGNRFFPSSGFRHIEKQPSKFGVFFFAVIFISGLTLLLRAPIANLLMGWPSRNNQINNIVRWLIYWRREIEAALYIIVFSGVVVAAAKLFMSIGTTFGSTNLSLKGANAQLDMEKQPCSDYIDQYAQELVYCLKKIGRKIDRTVVFEDMDRLESDVCIHIFTRLREINHVLNAQLDAKTYLRFVFVVEDGFVNKLAPEKFFDYVLPIIPSMNIETAEVLFRRDFAKVEDALKAELKREWRINETGSIGCQVLEFLDRHKKIRAIFRFCRNKLGEPKTSDREQVVGTKSIRLRGLIYYRDSKYTTHKCFESIERLGKDSLIHNVSPYISDYRLQHDILNEYAVFLKLFLKNNPEDQSENIAESILVAIIYKLFWPDDYLRFFRGEKCLLTGANIDEASNSAKMDLLKYLISSRKLDAYCLYYIGHSKDNVNANWLEVFRMCTSEEKIQMLENVEAGDIDKINQIKTHYVANSSYSHEIDTETFADILSVLLDKGYCDETDNFWFFHNRHITTCLQILSQMAEKHRTLFIKCCIGGKTDYDIFETCGERKSISDLNGKWTLEMAKTFVSGMSRNRIPQINLYTCEGQQVDLYDLRKICVT